MDYIVVTFAKWENRVLQKIIYCHLKHFYFPVNRVGQSEGQIVWMDRINHEQEYSIYVMNNKFLVYQVTGIRLTND